MLNFFVEKVNIKKIKHILLTGSLANGEGTIIRNNSGIITSDFDFIVQLDFFYYLKNRDIFEKISIDISEKLVKRKINTHVVFLPSTSLIRFKNSNIYEYEFAFSSKCIFGNKPSFCLSSKPSKNDALELTFTVASDLFFSDFKNHSKIEESYVYAKRSLTLLNSLLIFNGLFGETYLKRMKLAKQAFLEGRLPLIPDEIRLLDIFTNYKITGDLHLLLKSLGFENLNNLVNFQKKFLEKITLKILTFELNAFISEAKQPDKSFNCYHKKLEFNNLLFQYSKLSVTNFPLRAVGICLYVYWAISRQNMRKNLFANFLFRKQSPKTILNVIVAFLLANNGKINAKKINQIFPWCPADVCTNNLEELFEFWTVAEQSIKL